MTIINPRENNSSSLKQSDTHQKISVPVQESVHSFIVFQKQHVSVLNN